MLTPNPNPFVFVFRIPGTGSLGECSVEIKDLGPGGIVAILGEREGSREPLLPLLDRIATQLLRKRLRGVLPSQICWVLRSAGAEEESFQKIGMTWDGERFCLPRKLASLDRDAFANLLGLAS